MYPSSVEVDLVEFGTPVFGRPFVLPRWRLYWLREEFGTLSGLEILLGEGGDVELGARTSKHILLFAFDPLTLHSLSLLCVKHHSLFISYIACIVPCIFLIAISCVCLVVCVCLTCT